MFHVTTCEEDVRNYRQPRSTTTSGPPLGHGGVGQIIGAVVLTAVFLASMALLSSSWETNKPLSGLGFVVAGVVLGVVLTDKDLNRSVPGLTVVLLVFAGAPYLLPEAVAWDLPSWAIDVSEQASTKTAYYVIIGALTVATFRPFR